MRRCKRYVVPIAAFCGLFILIIDAKTAICGAQEGVRLCIQTLIPSLFPFFVVSGFFCNTFSGLNIPIINPIMRLCHLPKGSSPLVFAGFLGGYPVGAKVIAEAYYSGSIKLAEARRMLGFCSNAGPAFIFGMIGNQFQNPIVSWCLMLIIILSAVLTGCILPCARYTESIHLSKGNTGFTQNFNSSLQAITAVCGWVILFRVVLAFLNRWFLWLIPVDLRVVVTGILELSNGCIELNKISNDGLRFVIASGILSMGGLCVYLQTISITGAAMGTGLYFPGKIIQSLISVTLSCIIQFILFGVENRAPISIVLPSITIIVVLMAMLKRRIKNNSSNFCLIEV